MEGISFFWHQIILWNYSDQNGVRVNKYRQPNRMQLNQEANPQMYGQLAMTSELSS